MRAAAPIGTNRALGLIDIIRGVMTGTVYIHPAVGYETPLSWVIWAETQSSKIRRDTSAPPSVEWSVEVLMSDGLSLTVSSVAPLEDKLVRSFAARSAARRCPCPYA